MSEPPRGILIGVILVGVLFVLPATIFVAALFNLGVSFGSGRGFWMGVLFALVPLGYGYWAYRYVTTEAAKAPDERSNAIAYIAVAAIVALLALVAGCFSLLRIVSI